MAVGSTREVRKVPSYCYNCVAGQDLLEVKVVDGIATEILPNFAAENVHPGNGRFVSGRSA
jgi:phenylacetyl-CoA:acceptor oxidoreductase